MSATNRWMRLAAGVMALLFAGVVYAWSVLQAPIAATFPAWTKAELSLTFTLTMAFFCIGGFVGGLLQRRVPPRLIMWFSAALLLTGMAISSQATSLPMLYVGFGLLAGFASGLSYNAVLGSVLAWFPDRQGLVSGVLLMGFGIGSFAIGKIYTALTPSDGRDAWRSSLVVLAVASAAVVAACGTLMAKPPASWSPAADKSRDGARRDGGRPSELDRTPSQMVRTLPFWLFMVWTTVLSAAGLAVISQGAPMAREACPELAMDVVATLVGLISVANGLGRIASGAFYDRYGQRATTVAGGVLFLLAMGLLLGALTGHSFAVLVPAFLVTGLAYGWVPPTNSAFVSRFFGRTNYPVNLSVVNLNVLVASLGSTMAGAVFDATHSYVVIVIAASVLVAVATLVSCLVKEPGTIK